MKSNDYETTRINGSIDEIICAAIQDYAKEMNISEDESRDKLLASKTVALVYDASNGIWTQGPDALIELFKEIG